MVFMLDTLSYAAIFENTAFPKKKRKRGYTLKLFAGGADKSPLRGRSAPSGRLQNRHQRELVEHFALERQAAEPQPWTAPTVLNLGSPPQAFLSEALDLREIVWILIIAAAQKVSRSGIARDWKTICFR